MIEIGLPTGRASRRPSAAVPGVVHRPALFERLSRTTPGGVVVVCAPAGSGKTVLLRSWVEAAGIADRVGWVSVERGEPITEDRIEIDVGTDGTLRPTPNLATWYWGSAPMLEDLA